MSGEDRNSCLIEIDFEKPYVLPDGRKVTCSATITVGFRIAADEVTWEHHRTYYNRVTDIEIEESSLYGYIDEDEFDLTPEMEDFFMRQFDPDDYHEKMLGS